MFLSHFKGLHYKISKKNIRRRLITSKVIVTLWLNKNLEGSIFTKKPVSGSESGLSES